MEDQLSDEEREKLRLENEIRKIKLSLEKGAQFIEDPEMPSLPPEIENDFLNYIEQFESMHADSPKISVYDKAGKPSYKLLEDLDEDEISDELDNLLEILFENGIGIDTIHEVDDRELYRFIIEDLFIHEIYDMKLMKGMVTQFIYEDFYPDDEKDVKKCIATFFDNFFDKNEPTERYKYAIEDLDVKNKSVRDFRNAYDSFELNELEVNEVELDEEHMHAVVKLKIDFNAYLEGIHQPHHFSGECIVPMQFTPGGWELRSLVFPRVDK